MVHAQDQVDITKVGELEDRLSAMLYEAANEVAHTDCLDDEQRAEVYTILRALQADGEMHRGILSLLSRRLGGEYVADA